MNDSTNYEKNQAAVLKYITDHYAVANSPEEATIELTTTEIFKKIDEAFPEFFTPTELAKALMANGYRFSEVGLSFSWMLKELQK